MGELGFITQQDRQEAQRLRRDVDALGSAGGGGSGGSGPRAQQGGGRPWDTVWIKITDATQDSTKKRWKYSWAEVYKATAGFEGWQTLTGGLAGGGANDPFGYAYNTIEDPNAATGTYGNGVSSTNLSGSMALIRVANGIILRGWIVYPADNSTPEVWFAFENGINGGCV